MAQKRLTDIDFASGITGSDLIHIVITGDTSQNDAGSSYKVSMDDVLNFITDNIPVVESCVFKPGSVGPKVSFSKSAGSDPTTNKDVIIPGKLELTRDNGGGGLYNIVEDTFPPYPDTPFGTTWNSQFIDINDTSWADLWDIENRDYGLLIESSNYYNAQLAGMSVIMKYTDPDTSEERYWLIMFTAWGVGAYGEQGMFAYDRYEIYPAVSVVRNDNDNSFVDIISDEVHLVRKSNGGAIYNILDEPQYQNGVSPRKTKWNSSFIDNRIGFSGFNDLSNLESRVYGSFANALSFNIDNNILDTELIMHDLTTDLYWKFVFTDWTPNAAGGGFEYTRQVIPQSCPIKFGDGTVLTTAPNNTGGGGGTDFNNKYTIFVDPNGDDLTAEFGNKNKPFATLERALMAAIDFMENNDPFVLEPNISDFFISFLSPGCITSVSYRYPLRIQIQVSPGFYKYNPLLETDSFHPKNLMYNHIDWYFQPGAIVHNYVWDDTYNIIDNSSALPVYCNVYGHGTFNTFGFDYDINLQNTGSVLNIEGESSNYRISMSDGFCKAKFTRLLPFFLFPKISFGYYNTITGGELILKADIVNVIYEQNTLTFNTIRYIYQGGGKINLDFGRYTGINTSVIPEICESCCDYIDEISLNYEGGILFPGSWGWRIFREDVEDVAPILGYFGDTPPFELDDWKPAQSRIKIDYGKFHNFVIEVEGGDIEFYPGKIDVYPGSSEDGGVSLLGYFGGPYYSGLKSKFIMYGGIINFFGSQSGGDFFNPYGAAIDFYDNPIIYIKETQFIWDDIFNYISAIIYGGTDPEGNQQQALILDGAKFAVKSTDKIDKYLFFINSSPGEDPLNIRVYNNVFTNLNSTLLDPGSNNSVVNIIPSTNIIVDDNVLIFGSDVQL